MDKWIEIEDTYLTKEQWAKGTIQAGDIIKINGIPFELVEPAKITGHPRNFQLAGLEPVGNRGSQ